MKQGQIRIGRITYKKGFKVNIKTYPSFNGFTNIIVMTASSPYASLSPYCLKNDKCEIMENIWQFSKVYKNVPRTVSRYSNWDQRITWNHPEEIHVDSNGVPNENWKSVV